MISFGSPFSVEMPYSAKNPTSTQYSPRSVNWNRFSDVIWLKYRCLPRAGIALEFEFQFGLPPARDTVFKLCRIALLAAAIGMRIKSRVADGLQRHLAEIDVRQPNLEVGPRGAAGKHRREGDERYRPDSSS